VGEAVLPTQQLPVVMVELAVAAVVLLELQLVELV
jgi:hypothetical protein